MKLYTKIIEDLNPLMLIASLMVLSFAFTISAEDEPDKDVETVTIIGSKSDVAGSATVISNEDLQKVMDTDIHKICRQLFCPANRDGRSDWHRQDR